MVLWLALLAIAFPDSATLQRTGTARLGLTLYLPHQSGGCTGGAVCRAATAAGGVVVLAVADGSAD